MQTLRRSRAALLLAFVALLAGVLLSDPLRWPEPAIHWWLLYKVPVGSTSLDLQEVAKNSGWRVNATWSGHRPNSDWGGIDGATIAHVYIGASKMVLRTDVDSFWAFDEAGRLVDVRVRKSTDAP